MWATKRMLPVASQLAALVAGASPSHAQSAVWTVATVGFSLGFSTPEERPPLPREGQRLKCWCPVALGRAGAEPSHLLQPEVKDVTIIFPLAWPVVRKMSPKYVTAEGISVAHTSHQILQTGGRSPLARGPLSECGHVDSFIRKSGVQRRCESGPRRPAVQRAFLFQGGRDASV